MTSEYSEYRYRGFSVVREIGAHKIVLPVFVPESSLRHTDGLLALLEPKHIRPQFEPPQSSFRYREVSRYLEDELLIRQVNNRLLDYVHCSVETTVRTHPNAAKGEKYRIPQSRRIQSEGIFFSPDDPVEIWVVIRGSYHDTRGGFPLVAAGVSEGDFFYPAPSVTLNNRLHKYVSPGGTHPHPRDQFVKELEVFLDQNKKKFPKGGRDSVKSVDEGVKVLELLIQGYNGLVASRVAPAQPSGH